MNTSVAYYWVIELTRHGKDLWTMFVLVCGFQQENILTGGLRVGKRDRAAVTIATIAVNERLGKRRLRDKKNESSIPVKVFVSRVRIRRRFMTAFSPGLQPPDLNFN